MAFLNGRVIGVIMCAGALCAVHSSYAQVTPPPAGDIDFFEDTSPDVENGAAVKVPPPPDLDDDISAFTSDLFDSNDDEASQDVPPLEAAPEPIEMPQMPFAIDDAMQEDAPNEQAPVSSDRPIDIEIPLPPKMPDVDSGEPISESDISEDFSDPEPFVAESDREYIAPSYDGDSDNRGVYKLESETPAFETMDDAPLPEMYVDTIEEEAAKKAEKAEKPLLSNISDTTDEEKAQYRELKRHLMNFIRSVSGGEIIPEQEVVTPVVPVVEPVESKAVEKPEDIQQEEPEEDIRTDFSDFLELDSITDISDMGKQEEPEPVKEDVEVKTEPAPKSVVKDEPSFAGECAPLADNLQNCAAFSCSMPKAKGSDESVIRIVEPKGGECLYKEKTGSKVNIDCVLDESARSMLAGALRSYFDTKGAEEFNLPALLKPVCPPQVKKSKLKKIEKQPVKVAKPTPKEPEISPEDKAYFDMMEQKRKALPQNKRLSSETAKAIEDVAPNIADKKEEKQKKNDISINRGGEQSVSSNSGMKMSMGSKSGSSFNIKKKIDSAYKALMAGQVSASIALYKEALDKQPDNKDALFGLATAYHRNMQYSQARDIYIDVLKADPNNKEVLNNFLVLVADESPEDAILELQKLERVNSEFSPIPAQIAMIYLKIGQAEKAERYLRRAVILSPDNVTYKYNLAITSDRLKKYDNAARLYKQILEDIDNGAVISGSKRAIKERLEFLNRKLHR